jgi:dienelactone hydrolase
VTERVACDGYVRERVLFRAEQDMCIPAYLLIPSAPAPAGGNGYPVMICQHGHGHGKDDVAGITHGTLDRWDTRRSLRYDYGLALVQRGYVVMAMDARGFGERALGYPPGNGEYGCNTVQIKAQLLGLNLLTLNVFDLMRCVDYLHTRPEVDTQRLGCAGLSYGGTLTLFATALDERIGAAIISGYLGSLWEQTFVRGDTCGRQVVPNLLAWGELADVACLIAPRPLLIESGTEDELFDIEAARRACGRVEQVYAALNVPERMAHNVFEGGHRWDGTHTEAWLERRL